MRKIHLLSVTVLLLAVATVCSAQVTFIEYPIPTSGSVPNGITAGPDGNLWFAERLGVKIGKITTAGVITEFPVPTFGSYPNGITAGPDGNLWFTARRSQDWENHPCRSDHGVSSARQRQTLLDHRGA